MSNVDARDMCMRGAEPSNDSPCRLGRVVVTGAASGIGRATAAALLVAGWKVLALDRDRTALDQMLRELGTGDALAAHAVELTRFSEVERIMDSAADPVPLRGLVCCAAIGNNTPFLEISLESLRSVFEINFMATFALCQMAARQMVKNGGGAIVNISSLSGLRANAGRSAYGASKAALEMLSKIMAVELAPKHVRVNTLAPGPTLTSMAAGMHLGTERQRLLRSVPQGRYAMPEEIAEGVAFLLDDRRSSYITGHTLCIDGGMYCAGSFESGESAG